MDKQDEIRITVRFPRKDIEQLRVLAKEDTRSLNAEIVHAVQQFLLQKKRKGQKDA